MGAVYIGCLETTSDCIAAAERCGVTCGTSGNVERERCALVAHDCADIGRLVETLMLRHSRYAGDTCLLHATACDDFADYCAKWPHADCCRDARRAARACAAACRAYGLQEAA
jgi:hypothetical protein